MFRPTVQELLNIEKKIQRKFNKTEAFFLRKLGQAFGIVKKNLDEWEFLEVNYMMF
jgi:hypothetical protein